MAVLCRLVLSIATLAPLAAVADGSGLSTDADRVPWATFKGRVAYAAPSPFVAGLASSGDGTGLRVGGLSLMGDLYLGGSRDVGRTPAHGFRATSGVIVGARSTLMATPAFAPTSGLLSVDRRLFGPSGSTLGYGTDPANDGSGTVPYIGIGYSSLTARNGWSFSADLGLVSLAPGNAVRLGRVVGGSQNLDDVIRDMRLTPVLQLGAAYAF